MATTLKAEVQKIVRPLAMGEVFVGNGGIGRYQHVGGLYSDTAGKWSSGAYKTVQLKRPSIKWDFVDSALSAFDYSGWGGGTASDVLLWGLHGPMRLNTAYFDGHVAAFGFIPYNSNVQGTGTTALNYYVKGPNVNGY